MFKIICKFRPFDIDFMRILWYTIIIENRKCFKKGKIMHEKITGGALPSPLALAYLGDARHSLYIRRMLVGLGISKPGDLNRESLLYVTAKAQADCFLKIEPLLLDDEREIFRRAFNSTHLNKPKNAAGKDYRTATGFEALIGMLEWIGDEERIEELLTAAYERNDENDKEN